MILAVLLIIINVYILIELGKKPATGKQFEFIDCTQNECTGVSGFPTILHPDGNKSVGYTEV